MVTVQVTIQNTGKVLGAEVAQLYVSLPRRPSPTALPPRQLRGFAKTFLEAGATGTVEFKLRRKDLSYWDVKLKRFVVPKGPIEIYVGASSRDYKRLTGTIDPK